MHRPSARVSTFSLAFLAAFGFTAGAALAHPGPHKRDSVRMIHADTAARTRTPIVVYVNRNGGTVSAGDDDSSRGTSSLVERGSIKVPTWKGGEARWKKVMACVRERYQPFDLEITEERPAGGEYIEAMVGGQPSLLGYGHDVSGIAPYTGDVMHTAIVYIFAAGVDYDVEITCVDVLHEVGHALGLDHEYLCQDPMSYLWDCEQPKTFQDTDVSCGEDDQRACEDGSRTQNSFRVLARNVGLRDGAQLPDVPAAAPPATDDGEDAAPADGVDTASADDDPTAAASNDPGSAPQRLTVTIDGPTGVVAGNRMLTVTVHGHGDQVTDAALAWLAPDGRYTLSCAAMPEGGAASCRRKGDDFVFRLDVSTGWRYFAAVVVDAEGDTATSDPSSVYLK